MLTNRYGFPESIAAALRRSDEDYERVPDSYSVSELIGPPMVGALRRRHRAQIVEDVSDMAWLLLGTSVHYVIEKASKDAGPLFEERLRLQLSDGNGRKFLVTGKPDLLDADGWLNDYKVTSVWSFIGDKPEWEQQLNLYALLCGVNGHEVKGLRIVAILRDWQKSELLRDPARYPDCPLKIRIVPLWTREEQIQFLQSRLELHAGADAAELTLDSEFMCDAEDRWQKPDSWAVFKGQNKRAARVLSSEREAYDWIAAQNPKDSYRVEQRPSRPTRCLDYCNVREFCPFGQTLIDVQSEPES